MRAWRAVGITLVIFIDATVPLDKLGTWLARRRRDARTVVQLNEDMRRRSPRGERQARLARKESRKQAWVAPPFCQTHLGRAFRTEGCEVRFNAVHEADRCIAAAAADTGAFGVLAYDSDFLVLQMNGALYLNFQSLRIDRNAISVIAYDSSRVGEALQLSRQQLIATAAVLGTDVRGRDDLAVARARELVASPASVRDSDTVRAVAALVRGGGYSLNAPRVEEAAAWYDVAPPGDSGEELVQQPALARLLADSTFVGPLAVEDVSSKLSIHAALQPLRMAVYRRLGVTRVREILCSAFVDPEAWAAPDLVEVDAALPAAPAPAAGAVAIVRQLVQGPLLGLLSPAQAAALLEQASAPPEMRRRRVRELHQCFADDVQAQNLFVVAYELFTLGACDPPAIWDAFDGPLFHHLAQNPQKRVGEGGADGAQRSTTQRSFSTRTSLLRSGRQQQPARPLPDMQGTTGAQPPSAARMTRIAPSTSATARGPQQQRLPTMRSVGIRSLFWRPTGGWYMLLRS